MIMTGIDGVSRGDMNAGVMAGADMLYFVPLNLSELHRSPTLTRWFCKVGSATLWSFWNHHNGPEYIHRETFLCLERPRVHTWSWHCLHR
jgi:hypothetical protein